MKVIQSLNQNLKFKTWIIKQKLEERPTTPDDAEINNLCTLSEAKTSEDIQRFSRLNHLPSMNQVRSCGKEERPMTAKIIQTHLANKLRATENCDKVVQHVLEPRPEGITFTTSQMFLQNYSHETSVIAADITPFKKVCNVFKKL